MATILLAWELGGGLGHMQPLRAVGEVLVRRGHRVIAALRDLSRAETVFADTDISYLQAPIKTRPCSTRYDPPLSFAHLLHNIGFAELKELEAMTAAWRTIDDLVRPAVVVADHSPTALLAWRGGRTKVALLGSGFLCPPDTYPLPFLRPWANCDPARLQQDEDRLLETMNRLLQSRRQVPLKRVAQLYSQADENFLATFRELDHFGPRPSVRYYGAWPQGIGHAPAWPSGARPRVYCYLKPFGTLQVLLDWLKQSGLSTIVVADGIDPGLQDRYGCRTMRFENQPIELRQTAVECDLAIVNASHGTTAALLLAGKPGLYLPIFMEQLLLAKKVESLGAGVIASVTDAQQIIAGIQGLLASPRYAERAGTFAARYKGYQPHQQIAAVADRIEQLTAAAGQF